MKKSGFLILLFVFSCSEPYMFETQSFEINIVDAKVSSISGESYVNIYRLQDNQEKIYLSNFDVQIITDDGQSHSFIYNESLKRYTPEIPDFKGILGTRYKLEAIDSNGYLYTSSYDSITMPVEFAINVKDTTILELKSANVLVERKGMAAVAELLTRDIEFYSKLEFKYRFKQFFNEDTTLVSDPNEYVLFANAGESGIENVRIPIGYKLIEPWNFRDYSNPACDTIPLDPIFCSFCCETRESWQAVFEISMETMSFSSYEYWRNAKRLTSNDGLIFDTYPFPIEGNISCNECNDRVTGFFRTSTETSVKQNVIL